MAQTNTDWKAFLYTTEQSHGKGASVEHDLIALTNTFNKKYVSFLSVAKACSCSCSLSASVFPGVYSTFLFLALSVPQSTALNQILKHSECKWITATSGDNFYGSEVVDRILRAKPLESTRSAPDMVLAPTDSKFFAVAGEPFRILQLSFFNAIYEQLLF